MRLALFCVTRHVTRLGAQFAGCVSVVLSMVSMGASANTIDTSRYSVPPTPMVEMVDAPQVPQTILSPLNDWVLLMERPALPSVAELAQPELRLAGMRINPRTNDQSRQLFATGLRLLRVSDRAERAIQGVPTPAKIAEAVWSPDGKRIAFTLVKDNSLELMIVDLSNGIQTRRLVERPLNGLVNGRPMVWAADSKSLFVTLVAANRVAPRTRETPFAPQVQESLGKRVATRTFQDLLKNPVDEALLEYHLASDLVRVTLDGKMSPLTTGMIRSFVPSPDGEYVMVQTIKRPFSYSVPITRFPLRTEIRDARDANVGSLVKVLSELPLADEEDLLDPDAVRKGPRQYAWRADASATITWAQQADPKKSLGDYVFMLGAPFDAEPQLLMKLDLRFQSVQWASDQVALVRESSRRSRRVMTWRVHPGDPSKPPAKLIDRSSEDRYGDPGEPQTEQNSRGQRVLNLSPDGRAIYLIGTGASAEGERPFIDRFDLETRETKRLYRSDKPTYDMPLAIFDRAGQSAKLLLQRESPTEPPNLFVRDFANNSMIQITRFAAPKNPLANVQKELIKYKRRDGVELSATLYLPAKFRRGDDPLPLLMWAYPREFRSAEAAGQITGSPYRYVRPSFGGPLPFLTQGYAVLDNPTMPIVGESGKENDSYLPQLIASAEAAVDEVVRRGVADRNRIAVGGHSYGAFMVANLLAHTKFFAAGIAESGAYNRTLTPFGFQAEERNYWKAREVYEQMSPFTFADQIKAPILLIHGEADSNTGTFPLQSERMYQAIRGLGGTTRLVMLPYEDHTYRGRESVLHRLWESLRWLDKYVKNAEKR